MTTLRKGATGDTVKKLQTELNRAGAKLKVDGIFGNDTYNAVVAFQSVRGLTVDGVVGPKTWNELLTVDYSELGKAVKDCITDIQGLPSFAKLMELI